MHVLELGGSKLRRINSRVALSVGTRPASL